MDDRVPDDLANNDVLMDFNFDMDVDFPAAAEPAITIAEGNSGPLPSTPRKKRVCVRHGLSLLNDNNLTDHPRH